jgi:hypothetical protein
MLLLKIAAVAACLLAPNLGLRADEPGRHPAYLHALSDLRAAKWNIEHRPGSFVVSLDEKRAVDEIWTVIKDIQRASIDDGKDLADHPAVDEALDYNGHLQRAMVLLHRCRRDLARAEDDPSVRGLRNRSLVHLDRAMHQVKKAIHAAGFGR